MSKNLDRRVESLEDQIYDFSFPPDSTRIDYDSLTQKEKDLCAKFQAIIDRYGEDPPEEVLAQHRDVVSAISKILMTRSFDLFRSIIVSLVCRDNLEEYIFYSRFFGFLRETFRIIDMHRFEDVKTKELFGDDLDNDDIEIPDDDPRWKILDEYMQQFIAEQKAKQEQEDAAQFAEIKAKMEREKAESEENG